MNTEGERDRADLDALETNDQGLRDIMRAVLLDAIMCLRGRVGAPEERERLAREARYWMASTARTWPFSFESICDVLGLSAPYLRRLLLPSQALAQGAEMAEGDVVERVVRRLAVLRRHGNEVTHIRPHRRSPKRRSRRFGGLKHPYGKNPV
jgi:hypothetical protein